MNLNYKAKIKKIIFSAMAQGLVAVNITKNKKDLFINIELNEEVEIIELEKEIKEKLSKLYSKYDIKILFSKHNKFRDSSSFADKTPPPKVKVQASSQGEGFVEGGKEIILICSGKGGVGKSTICYNLAMAASKKGKKVAIVDADIYGPSMHHLFGVPAGKNPVIKNGLMIPFEKNGVKFNSMGLIIPEGKALIWKAPMITKSLNNLFNQTNWGEVDAIFVDLPPGTGDTHIKLLKMFNNAKAILITEPEKISLIDMERYYDMLLKFNIKILGVIENMCIEKSNFVKKFAKSANLKLLAQINFSKEIRSLKGKDIFKEKKLKTIAEDLLQIAEKDL